MKDNLPKRKPDATTNPSTTATGSNRVGLIFMISVTVLLGGVAILGQLLGWFGSSAAKKQAQQNGDPVVENKKPAIDALLFEDMIRWFTSKQQGEAILVTANAGAGNFQLSHLKEWPQIASLRLENNEMVTDPGLAVIKFLPNLESLYIGNVPCLTDAGLVHLQGADYPPHVAGVQLGRPVRV